VPRFLEWRKARAAVAAHEKADEKCLNTLAGYATNLGNPRGTSALFGERRVLSPRDLAVEISCLRKVV